MAELQDIGYERVILGSIIFDPLQMGKSRALGLRNEHFFLPFHQLLFTLLESLYEDEAIDEEIIRSRMGKSFDEMEMLEIISVTPVFNLQPYITKLIEMANLRSARNTAVGILQQIDMDNADYSDVLKSFNEGIDRLEHNVGGLVSIRTMSSIEAKEAEFVCKGWLPFPKRAVSLITAGGGAGKSFLMMQAAIRMIRDEGLRVFMWLSEDPAELSRYRFEMICKRVLGTEEGSISEKLELAASDSPTIHILNEERGSVSVNAEFYRLKKILEGYDVIILDPLIAFFGGDENNNTHARQFINLFSRWANVEDKTIIFIHHGTKNSSQSRGASAFVDAVRLAYQVDLIKNKEGDQIEEQNRLITIAKDNNGAKKYLGGYSVKRKVFPEKNRENIVVEFQKI